MESSTKLSTLLNELETALPVLAGTGRLVQTDWSDLDRRLNGVRSVLADRTLRRRSRRARSANTETTRTGLDGSRADAPYRPPCQSSLLD